MGKCPDFRIFGPFFGFSGGFSGQNGQNRAKSGVRGPKSVKIGQNGLESVEIGENRSKSRVKGQNRWERIKSVGRDQIGERQSKSVEIAKINKGA